MEAIIVAGQYGVGKTETIKGLIRTAAAPNMRIGAFVAESANIALDQNRYGIGSNASGFSFASVCCPTIADMNQALDVALRDKKYDLLFFEPPGNMHPPLMAQVAIEKGFSPQHVIMLVSQRDFDQDRHRTTFHSGLEIANVVGVTHMQGQLLRPDIIDTIRKANSNASIISFSKSGLDYSMVQSQPKWSLTKLAGMSSFEPEMHSDHYQKVMRVFNPDLNYDQIISLLNKIADTGIVERGKGIMPKYNKQIDIKRKFLEINTSDTLLSPKSIGYLVCFGKEKLPMDLIDQIALAPEQRTRELFEDSSQDQKLKVFGRLYQESEKNRKMVIANGEVTYTYSPLDDAEKVASEIYEDCKDDSAVRMILPVYHGTRLYALKELSAKQNPTAKEVFAGVHISAVLINTSLRSDGGFDYSKRADQHQVLEIKKTAVPSLLDYASMLAASEIKDFPRYELVVGPYILKAARVGLDSLSPEGRTQLYKALEKAKMNMERISREAGFDKLAESWRTW